MAPTPDDDIAALKTRVASAEANDVALARRVDALESGLAKLAPTPPAPPVPLRERLRNLWAWLRPIVPFAITGLIVLVLMIAYMEYRRPGPVDPNPTPVVPIVDPWAAGLQEAWAKETAADKARIHDLAALYRQSAPLAKDPKQTTASGLHDVMKAARVALIGDALPNVRAEITKDFDGVLLRQTAGNVEMRNNVMIYNGGGRLDDASRELCAKTFVRMAGLLEALK